MSEHHIVEGNEKFGVCGRCGLQGDLTQISCEGYKKLHKRIESMLQKGKRR